MELRPYQTDLINKCRAEFSRGKRRVLIVAPCGAGKTVLAAYMAGNCSGRVLFLAHRRELLDQTNATFVRAGIKTDHIDVMSIQTAARRVERLPEYRLIIADECFPAGTLVDDKPIESIKVGDVVRSYNHETGTIELRTVTRTFKHNPSSIVVVRAGGKKIVCTGNHPFFTKRGYIAAKDLEVQDELFDLREGNSGEQENVLQGTPPYVVVDQNVTDERREEARNHREDENEKSDDESIRAGKVNEHTSRNALEASCTLWERTRPDEASVIIGKRARKCSDGVCCEDYATEGIWLSNIVQAGHSNPGENAVYRSGRNEPLFAGTSGTGQEKNGTAQWVRVDSVEIQKSGSDGKYSGLCPDGYVYNIEVEHNHNYFVSGILVHNCHHSAAESWSRVLDSQPNAYIVGLTATPCRLDGRGLNGQFDAMVQGITTAELIDRHYLAPYRVFVADTIDRAALKTRCGDFTAASVMAQVEQRKIYGHAVTAYKRFCDGLQAIVYCCSIQHSKAVTEAFRTAGIAAEHLDADTPAKQRADIVERFRTGEVKILSNVDLLGEGFDVPACDAVILQRPTQSLSLHIQQAMRSMRYAPGKTAYIIDHVGNIGKHGLPDEIREWTLDGKPKRTREPGISMGRQCPECGYLNAAGATRCDFCGAEIKPQERQETEIVNAELREITAEERAERLKKRKREEGAARTYADLVALGRQRGYKPGWAYMRAKARGII